MPTPAQQAALHEGQALFDIYIAGAQPGPKWRDLTDETQSNWQRAAEEFIRVVEAPDSLVALQQLVRWVEAVGVERMPALAGCDITPLLRARSVLQNARAA